MPQLNDAAQIVKMLRAIAEEVENGRMHAQLDYSFHGGEPKMADVTTRDEWINGLCVQMMEGHTRIGYSMRLEAQIDKSDALTKKEPLRVVRQR